MKIAIIVSKKDIAGMTIKKSLLNEFDFTKDNDSFIYNNIKLFTIDEDSVHFDNEKHNINADLFIFATRHQSASGKPSLSCHAPGNWNNADMGGEANTLGIAPSNLLKNSLIELNGLNTIGYDVTMEATHHGPTIEVPSMFIEIGSSEKEWKNSEAGNIIANAIMNAINSKRAAKEFALGIGGPHYCSNFNRIQLDTDIALGHICPRYHIESLNESLISHAIRNNLEKIDFILLDWKGLGPNKQRLLKIFEKLKIEHKRTKQV